MYSENPAVQGGYVDHNEVSTKVVNMPSPEAAKLFVDLCKGIDWWNAKDASEKNCLDDEKILDMEIDGSYRYEYHPKLVKKTGKVVGCNVHCIDIGE